MVNRVLVANIRAYCKVTKFSLVVKIITDKTLYQGNSNFKYEQINVNRYECDVKIVQDFFFYNWCQFFTGVHVLVTNKIIKHHLKSDTPP